MGIARFDFLPKVADFLPKSFATEAIQQLAEKQSSQAFSAIVFEWRKSSFPENTLASNACQLVLN